jgi:hypothetical protein
VKTKCDRSSSCWGNEMTHDEYVAMKTRRDYLVEEMVAICGEGNRKAIEGIMTLTRILDRAAAEYAAHYDDAQYEGREGQA